MLNLIGLSGWSGQIPHLETSKNNAAIKLNKVNVMLSKVKQHVDIRTLKSIYYAIF